jgi:hypothetical protein
MEWLILKSWICLLRDVHALLLQVFWFAIFFVSKCSASMADVRSITCCNSLYIKLCCLKLCLFRGLMNTDFRNQSWYECCHNILLWTFKIYSMNWEFADWIVLILFIELYQIIILPNMFTCYFVICVRNTLPHSINAVSCWHAQNIVTCVRFPWLNKVSTATTMG